MCEYCDSGEFSCDMELDEYASMCIDEDELLFSLDYPEKKVKCNYAYKINYCPMCSNPLEKVKPLTKEQIINSHGKPYWCQPFASEGFWYVDTNLGKPHAGTLMGWRDEKLQSDRFLQFSKYGNTWLAYSQEIKRGVDYEILE